jgi:hypothetical protein
MLILPNSMEKLRKIIEAVAAAHCWKNQSAGAERV